MSVLYTPYTLQVDPLYSLYITMSVLYTPYTLQVDRSKLYYQLCHWFTFCIKIRNMHF